MDSQGELLRFVRSAVAYRAAHPVLRGQHHPYGMPIAGQPYAQVSWHGESPWQPDWSADSRMLALMWYGQELADGEDDIVYVGANAHWEPHLLEPPALPDGWWWELSADTSAESPGDFYPPGEGPPVYGAVTIGPRSTVILTGRRTGTH